LVYLDFLIWIFAITGLNLLFPHLVIRIFVSRKDSAGFRRNTSMLKISNESIELW